MQIVADYKDSLDESALQSLIVRSRYPCRDVRVALERVVGIGRESSIYIDCRLLLSRFKGKHIQILRHLSPNTSKSKLLFPDSLLPFKGHFNIVARAFPGTQTASLAKIVIKFIHACRWRYLDSIIRAVHETIVALEAEAATQTTACFSDNILSVKRRINLLKTFQAYMNRHRFLVKSVCRLIVISIQILRIDHRRTCQAVFGLLLDVVFDGISSMHSLSYRCRNRFKPKYCIATGKHPLHARHSLTIHINPFIVSFMDINTFIIDCLSCSDNDGIRRDDRL